MKRSIPSLFLVCAVWSVDGIVASMVSPFSGQATVAALSMRGGASPSSGKKSKKSSKKKESPTSSKEVIAEAMKEKDAAEALGDAIR